MTNPDPLITIRGLNRTYREGEQARQVLRDLDLEVGRGECVALLGRSGCGKSTLLNLISGIDRPDAGQIRIDGVELTALDEYRRTLFRRRHIGFVYQFFNLIPTLTVEENLLLPLELNGLNGHEG
ncbi:MAG: ATP-binding cassette domain-containing protein, partial [Gammaproteobacteria bacterium]